MPPLPEPFLSDLAVYQTRLQALEGPNTTAEVLSDLIASLAKQHAHEHEAVFVSPIDQDQVEALRQRLCDALVVGRQCTWLWLERHLKALKDSHDANKDALALQGKIISDLEARLKDVTQECETRALRNDDSRRILLCESAGVEPTSWHALEGIVVTLRTMARDLTHRVEELTHELDASPAALLNCDLQEKNAELEKDVARLQPFAHQVEELTAQIRWAGDSEANQNLARVHERCNELLEETRALKAKLRDTSTSGAVNEGGGAVPPFSPGKAVEDRGALSSLPWRTGRKVGRTIYSEPLGSASRLIGVMDRVEDAAHVVTCVTALARVTAERDRLREAASAVLAHDGGADIYSSIPALRAVLNEEPPR